MKFKREIRRFLLGRNIKIIDRVIFKISRKKNNSWRVGNLIRNRLKGKRKSYSNIPIIFVSGCPRSGTTLLYNLMKIFNGVIGPTEEICVFQDLSSHSLLENAFGVSKEEINEIFMNSKKDKIKAWDKIIKIYLKKNKGKNIILRAPKNVLFLRELKKYFPKSRIINISRDGRDVVLSMKYFFKKQLDENIPLECNVRTWVTCINQGIRFKSKDYINLFYEKIVENPHKEMKRISKFLGFPTPRKKEIDNFYKKINSKKLEKISPTHRKQLFGGISKKSIKRWEKEMNSNEKKIFKRIAGDILIKLGYERDNNW